MSDGGERHAVEIVGLTLEPVGAGKISMMEGTDVPSAASTSPGCGGSSAARACIDNVEAAARGSAVDALTSRSSHWQRSSSRRSA